MTIAVETTPQTRWQNREGRTHRGKGGGRLPRYWTRERCLEVLAEHIRNSSGMLQYNRAYDRLCKGRNLPPHTRVYEYFDSANRAWLLAGAPKNRVHRLGCRWATEEDEYLREYAGIRPRTALATHLHRTDAGVKRRLYDLGILLREHQGYMSAQETARRLDVSEWRVRRLVADGRLAATKPDGVRNRWQIDPELVTEDLIAELRRPPSKRTGPEYTHAELQWTIRMREDGETWAVIGRQLGRHPRAIAFRYEFCFDRRPLWRAVWFTVKELGRQAAILDVVKVMIPRGHRVTYTSVRRAALRRPEKLRVDDGVVSVVTHTSKRVRPYQRGQDLVMPGGTA